MRDWIRHKIDSLNSGWFVFWVFCLFLVLPIWMVEYPPMVDLPGHASQIQMMHNLRAEGFLYSDLFKRNYLTAYWGGYIPVYFLSYLFGVLSALKITITLALVCIPYFTKKIVNRFGGNPAWIWLCFPVAYSNPFYWGFLNYILTVAIGLAWVYFCIRLSDRERVSWQNQLLVALGVVVLFFGHLIACGMLWLIVAIYYSFLNRPLIQRLSLLAPLLVFIPVVGGFYWLKMPNASGLSMFSSMLDNINLDYHPYRYQHSLSLLVGRITWWSDLAGFMLFITPFLAGGVLSHRLSRLLPFVIIILFVLLLPTTLKTSLVYQRFFVFVLPLLLLALEYRPEMSSILRNLLPITIASVVMSMNAWDFMEFGAEQKNYNTVIERTDPDSRIFKVVFQSTSRAGDFSHPVYDHFPSWHYLRGKGLVDFNFAGFGAMPVTYRDRRMVYMPRSGFNWKRHRGECYDYILSRANVDPFFSPGGKLRTYKDKVELIVTSGKWFLHKNRSPIVCN